MTKTIGYGNPKSICILFQDNGIGDEICAMPGLWQKKQDGFDITIYGRTFMKPVFDRMGIALLDGADIYQQPGTIELLQEKYGVIYSCSLLCTEHEILTGGAVTKTRFEQFAERIETALPDEFDFCKWLLPERGEAEKEIVLFAPYSTHRPRSYSEVEKAFTCLSDAYETEFIGLLMQPALPFEGLMQKIYDARLVVSIDNGILHLALALGAPVLALLGGSDEWSIVRQYGKYRSMGDVHVLRSQIRNSECERPCSFQKARGFDVNHKCTKPGSFADCLNEILPEDISSAVTNFLH